MSVDWTWRWCDGCGVVYKEFDVHPPSFCPAFGRPAHTPGGPQYGLDLDRAGQFARCQSCSLLVDINIAGHCPANQGTHFIFASFRYRIAQGKPNETDSRAGVFDWDVCTRCGGVFHLGRPASDHCFTAPAESPGHTARGTRPSYTLLAGVPPSPPPPQPDPGHVWGYFTLVDTALPVPASYHLYAPEGTPSNGPPISVEFMPTSGGPTAVIEVGSPHAGVRLPPATATDDPNLIVWSVRLLGDANYHGRPVMPGYGVPLPDPEPLDAYSLGYVRYNPAEWRYAGIRTAQRTRIFFGVPLAAHDLGGGILDTLIPGVPDLPPHV